ncbi:hypothetical protein TorRG33x02_226570 [Trema orientale]|uniref:Uncharacterized protein n=1 Tax=Trema orientale TaxID=63057 RepID=A0A2P5E7K9_TREOI|nr:hypothetical protein TorRG33x02_226570 [Trema orientale]
MVFIKSFMALLLLAVVAKTAEADAHVERFGVSDYPSWCPVESCTRCQCEEVSGTIICRRTDTTSGRCPTSCDGVCACDRSVCFKCTCTHEVKNCPVEFPTSTAETMFENLLALTRT